jgi:hypothetical protein
VFVVNQFANESLQKAVELWCSKRPAAEEQFGHITTWDTSNITSIEKLFAAKREFNMEC